MVYLGAIIAAKLMERYLRKVVNNPLKELEGILSRFELDCVKGGKHDNFGEGTFCDNDGLYHLACSKCGYDFECAVCMVRRVRDT